MPCAHDLQSDWLSMLIASTSRLQSNRQSHRRDDRLCSQDLKYACVETWKDFASRERFLLVGNMLNCFLIWQEAFDYVEKEALLIPLLHQLLTRNESLRSMAVCYKWTCSWNVRTTTCKNLANTFHRETYSQSIEMVRYLKDCCGFFHLRYAIIIIAVLEIVSILYFD